MLEDCYNCLCKNGLENTSMRQLAEACGTTTGNFYSNYFKNRDEIIVEATEYCMSKVEQDFMMYAPKTIDEVEKYLREMPKITAKLHGEKYRIMYQVYTSPKYLEYGKKFFDGVVLRYDEYAGEIAKRLNMPYDSVRQLIYIFVRASVHYALFGNEEYLNAQIDFIVNAIRQIWTQCSGSQRPADATKPANQNQKI